MIERVTIGFGTTDCMTRGTSVFSQSLSVVMTLVVARLEMAFEYFDGS